MLAKDKITEMISSKDEEMARLGALMALEKGHRWCVNHIPSSGHKCEKRYEVFIPDIFCDCNVMETKHIFIVTKDYRHILFGSGVITYGFNHKKYEPLSNHTMKKTTDEKGNTIYKPKGQKNASNLSRSLSLKK